MADFGVFIGFGYPARGREEAAARVFGELVQFLTTQSQQGNVESIEPCFLQPHGGDLGGFVLVRGERATLDQMVATDEFQRLATRAQMIVDDFGVVNATLGAGIEKSLNSFLSDTADLR